MNRQIAHARLRNHRLSGRGDEQNAEELVRWFGAVQAQEYGHARWGLGLRLHGRGSDADVRRAVDEGRIVRTHVMRPTWHFVARADIRWLLDLTAPRVQQRLAVYIRRSGLTGAIAARALRVVERCLSGGRSMTRLELGDELSRARLALKGLPLYLFIIHAELERVLCSGSYRAKQLTYALFADRVPMSTSRSVSRDEALAELTRRFFRSHGPATVRDAVWWSGLKTADIVRGLDMIGAVKQTAGGLAYWTADGAPPGRMRRAAAHLLPIYDEYVVAYRDREAVPHGPGASGCLQDLLPQRHDLVRSVRL